MNTKKALSFFLSIATLTFFTGLAHADSVSINFENPPYSIGNINSQDGWIKSGLYDVSVAENTFGFSAFGDQSLRISDAVTSGSFGDQAFAKPLVNSTGETISTAGVFSVGTKQPHFETQFDIASTQSTVQTGMHLSFSPDRGDGSRMSYLRFEDQVDGIHIFFDDVSDSGPLGTIATFNETDIATITRTPHTIKLTIDFLDGAGNDIVKVWVDGVLAHTGTSWEDYYRFDPEASAEQSPRVVKTVLFRESGTANDTDASKGFVIDNLSLSSGPMPSNNATVHIFKFIDGVQATSESANGVNFPMFTSTFNAPFVLGPAGWTTGDLPYEASTSPMSLGSTYSAEENLNTNLVGITCDGIHQYSLLGYSIGDTFDQATSAETSTQTPSFTGLQGDKYIIVKNHLCPSLQMIKVHILKYLDGIPANNLSSSGYQFPMIATWKASNLNGGTSSSGNYVLGNFHGGSLTQYGADTSPMAVPADYSTHEVSGEASQVVTSPDSCSPGKYLLNGYKTSNLSFVDAVTRPLSLVPPIFVGLTSDRYIIVNNTKCPTGGTISGTKFNDRNRNGKKNTNESGLSGWVIKLISGNKVIATATTDVNGNYSFLNVTPGTYKLREVHKTGWKRISKNPKAIVIISGSVVTNVDFGNAQKRKEERDDNDNDDNRDEQSGLYFAGHGKSNYDRDQRNSNHYQKDNNSNH